MYANRRIPWLQATWQVFDLRLPSGMFELTPWLAPRSADERHISNKRPFLWAPLSSVNYCHRNSLISTNNLSVSDLFCLLLSLSCPLLPVLVGKLLAGLTLWSKRSCCQSGLGSLPNWIITVVTWSTAPVHFFKQLIWQELTLLLFRYSVGQDTVKQTSEDREPLPAPASVTDTDVDVDMNASPANDDPIVPTDQTTETETTLTTADESKPSSTNSNSKETSQENTSKDSTEKAISEGSTNKPTTSTKTKSSRDKNTGSATGGRVTSKSHNSGSESGGNAGGTSRKPAPNSQAGCAGNYILEPDPKV